MIECGAPDKVFLGLYRNIISSSSSKTSKSFDPSFEPPKRDGFEEGSQCIVLWKKEGNILKSLFYPLSK